MQEFEAKQDCPAIHETVQVPEHELAAVAPVAALYLPAAQTTQSASSSWRDANDAASARYLPASQDVQAGKEVVL